MEKRSMPCESRLICSLTRTKLKIGWGARIRTWDGGTKNHCLTAWLRPNMDRIGLLKRGRLYGMGGGGCQQPLKGNSLLSNPI